MAKILTVFSWLSFLLVGSPAVVVHTSMIGHAIEIFTWGEKGEKGSVTNETNFLLSPTPFPLLLGTLHLLPYSAEQ